jgi:hypothetical protein
VQWLVVHACQLQYTIQAALLQLFATRIGTVGNGTPGFPIAVVEFGLEGIACLGLTLVSVSQKRDFFD